MVNRMTINETEVIFQSPKPFLESNPYDLTPIPGDGFTITWDDGHIDNLPGQWVGTNPVYAGRLETWRVTFSEFFEPGKVFWRSGTVKDFQATVSPPQILQDLRQKRFWYSTLYSPQKGKPVFGCSNPTGSIETCNGINASNQIPYNQALWRYEGYQRYSFRVDNLELLSVDNAGILAGYEARNNLGDAVFRPILIEPTITPNLGGCELTLNFDDGSDLFFGTVDCDSDIEIFSCFECPGAIPIAREILSKLGG